jgi:hypothetical protein
MLTLVVLISIGWTAGSQAMEFVPVTSFDSSWAIETYGSGIGTAIVTTNGANVILSAQNSTTTEWIEKKIVKNGTSGIIGVMATIRFDQAMNGPNGSCGISVKQCIGKVGNNKIQLAITLLQKDNQKSIEFSVTSTDLTTQTENIHVYGRLGNSNGAWAIGENNTVAFARVGSEYWFYVKGHPELIKIQSFEEVTSYDSPPSLAVVSNGVSSIAGVVSDIYMIQQ